MVNAPASSNTFSANDSAEQDAPVLIQVGLYSKQENAQSMLDRLKSKGFTGTMSSKTVSGTPFWQVTLSPGADANQTIMILKDAGFESFPVFQE
jgi:cell division septation protein DedD